MRTFNLLASLLIYASSTFTTYWGARISGHHGSSVSGYTVWPGQSHSGWSGQYNTGSSDGKSTSYGSLGAGPNYAIRPNCGSGCGGGRVGSYQFITYPQGNSYGSGTMESDNVPSYSGSQLKSYQGYYQYRPMSGTVGYGSVPSYSGSQLQSYQGYYQYRPVSFGGYMSTGYGPSVQSVGVDTSGYGRTWMNGHPGQGYFGNGGYRRFGKSQGYNGGYRGMKMPSYKSGWNGQMGMTGSRMGGIRRPDYSGGRGSGYGINRYRGMGKASGYGNYKYRGGMSKYGRKYGGRYGGKYGRHYGRPYGGKYGGNHGRSYGGKYGGNHGRSYGGKYGGNHGRSYGGKYGENHGRSYGGKYGGNYGGNYGSKYGGKYGR